MIEQRAADSKVTPEETRERIMLAAREVMKRKGKRGATTREIADVAGVNEATLFRHFGNKEALIVAVAKYSCPDLKLRATIEALSGPVDEDLVAIGREMDGHLSSMIDMIRWSLVEAEYEESVFAREAWRPQAAIHDVIGDFMAAQVQAGRLHGNPRELADMFMGMIFSRVIAREKMAASRIFSDRDYGIKFIVDIFLNGVRSK
jgi:AcrR family transcriptional regulator